MKVPSTYSIYTPKKIYIYPTNHCFKCFLSYLEVAKTSVYGAPGGGQGENGKNCILLINKEWSAMYSTYT